MTESSKINLAKKVKQFQDKLGLSQEKLARLPDVSNSLVIDVEMGKQSSCEYTEKSGRIAKYITKKS